MQQASQTSSSAPAPSAASAPPRHLPAIRVVGVGGAGLNAVCHMAARKYCDLSFAGVDTDARALAQAGLPDTFLAGANLTRGLGAGGDPDMGRAAADMDAARLGELCSGADLVIVVAGLGGGTGSGVAPAVGRQAREKGALVLALAALPFGFEGQRRQQQAQAGLRALKTACDAVICFPNQKVLQLIARETRFAEALTVANDMLARGLLGLWRLIIRPGLINVDFADLCRAVRGRHAESCFATAEAAGENRARLAVEQLLASPMLDGGRFLGEADAVLVSIAGGPDMRLDEVDKVMDQINRACENKEVVMGAAVDDACEDRLAVTIVATKRSSGELSNMEQESDGAELDPRGGGPPVASLEFDTQHLSQQDSQRPPSRFTPPGPALTPEQAERILRQQDPSFPRQRRKVARLRQGLLPLEVIPKNRFAQSEPTIHEGDDLDTPTFVRRGIALN